MKKYFLTLPIFGALALAALLGGCHKDSDTQPTTDTGTVTLALENVAGAKDVAVDGTTVYTTAAGETFTISTLKYYISNLVLTKTDGTTYAAPNFYHLVDASKSATTTITVGEVPAGNYSGMQFTVGVDSTMTKADPTLFTGSLNDLNSANNMYWGWNSGHIFLKLEGLVTSANNKVLQAHIGGYRLPYSAIVTAKPSLNGNTLLVRAGHSPEIHLAADVLKAFSGPNQFTLSNFPTAMMPSANSVQVAQNYGVGTSGSGMFTVLHLYAN